MYVYVNTTEAALQENFTKLYELQERVRNGTGENVASWRSAAGAIAVWWNTVENDEVVAPNVTGVSIQMQIKFCSVASTKRKTQRCHPTETEPLPPELQPLMAADGDEVNATDPIVQLFLKRQRRIKEVKKRREAGVLERLQRFAEKKYYTIRRG